MNFLIFLWSIIKLINILLCFLIIYFFNILKIIFI